MLGDPKEHPLAACIEAVLVDEVHTVLGQLKPQRSPLESVVERGERPGGAGLLPHAFVGVEEFALSPKCTAKAAVLTVNKMRTR